MVKADLLHDRHQEFLKLKVRFTFSYNHFIIQWDKGKQIGLLSMMKGSGIRLQL